MVDHRATAIRLASEGYFGTTANNLAGAAGCSERTAQRVLAALVKEGVLEVEVPDRKGKERGDWLNTYRLVGRRLSRFSVHLMIEGRSAKAVKDELAQALPGVSCHVERPAKASSRADRLAQAEAMRDSSADMVEELRGELESWYEGMPENLQSSEKADRLQEAISALEEIHSALTEVSFDGVEFPSMFG